MGDLREELEKVFDEAGDVENVIEEGNPPVIKDEEDDATPIEELGEAPEGDEFGEKPPVEEPEEKPPAEAELGENDDTTDKPDQTVKTEKAPVGWSPKSREQWAGLPADLKTQINKREREVNDLLQNTANARRLDKAFTQTVEPYRALMASQGIDNPLEAVDGLLKTAATLSMGTPQQKAQRIAELISHYGVGIADLDNILGGEPQHQEQPQGQNDAINQAVNAALQPYMQQQQQQQYQNDQAMTQRVAQGVQKVSEKEFFNDLRFDMADIMEMGTKRGQIVTLDQAYDRAVSMHPEITEVLAARKATGGLQLKKKAGSSIRASRGGKAEGMMDLSLHDTLSTLWDGGELT